MPTTTLNNDNLVTTSVESKTTNNHQRHSSSTFIAHLLVQEYPPKVQPRSSSARDNALFGHLDRVDAEAGCILIALANHDKKKDMNDLIPYSIRVIDYNQIATPMKAAEPTIESTNGDSNSSNSSTSDSASPHTDNEDPTTTSTMTMKDDNDNNGSMSITNLIGSMSSTEEPALVKSGIPHTSNQQQPLTTNSIPSLTATGNEDHINNIQDQSSLKPSSWKRKTKTDPILLLAAAAKAIDQDEQLQQRANQKRKYSDDDSSLDSPAGPSTRPRHSVEDSQAVVDQRQSEKSKFSYQYLSMKQNPKIKRNAMHAYITYMIYTDLASSDKYQHDKGTYHQHHQQNEGISATGPPLPLPPATITTSYAPLPPSPHPTTSNHRGTTTGPSLSTPLTYDQQYPQHSHSKHHSYTSRINIPASGTTGTNASSSETSFTNTWPYGLSTPSTSIPSTSSPPSLIHSGPSSIMARPLTAFLRDDMYS